MENEALIFPAKITEDSSSGSKSCWVVELEDLLKEVKTSGRSSPVFFSVAKAFLASEQEYYVPRFISVGPYHFERADLKTMEPHKNEAVLRMQQRIPGRTMQSIVEKEIVAMDKNVREFYDKEFSCSAIDLAWMVTKDSCFLFEFMFNYLRTRRGRQDFRKDCVVEGRYDAVLSSSRMNPMWKNVLYDLALFENQIPLSVLQRLLDIAYSESKAEMILGDILGEVASIHSNMVFRWGVRQSYERQTSLHFLEVLYYHHVGWDLALYRGDAHSDVGSTKSIFTSCSPWGTRDRGVENQVSALQVKLPSAADLKKKGVNICAVTSTNNAPSENLRCILCIRFEEETSTLYLPEVRIDHLGHALLRNFIALEFSSEKYNPSPITTFAFFMNELLDSEEDVDVLREANIIKNFFGSNKEAAECFNAITRSYPVFEGCKPIDDARVGLHKYLTRKYKILWSEFRSIYFAKPWLVAGFIVATLILVMTVLQVFCRFYTCNRRS